MCIISLQTKETGYVFPLYVYVKNGIADNDKRPYHKHPNLNADIIKQIAKLTELQFTEEKEDNINTFAPIDILDYIYAVLHNPAYREHYKEFLKIDFPRVPYPESTDKFWTLVKLGSKLRSLHLMTGIEPQNGLADYPERGSNKVEKIQYVGDKVYINDTQYFDRVPPQAWNFFIGGYQPAQKWLKNQKGRILEYEDIRHYQKIIHVLKESGSIMKELDKLDLI
jgi:predicted helicase